MGYRDQALTLIENILNYVQRNAESDLPLGSTLEQIKRALEVLIQLYGQLHAAPMKQPAPTLVSSSSQTIDEDPVRPKSDRNSGKGIVRR
jgi:hypothetical protein